MNAKTGKLVRGTEITLKRPQTRGGRSKSAANGATMPEQMLKYRAAAFFARTECPEVLMGFQTAEEVQDVNGYDEPEKKFTVITLEPEGN